MSRLSEISRTGLDAVVLHPLRSLATVGSLVVLLAPYIAGMALSRGIESQADDSIAFGADLYVTGGQFGRNVPIPLEMIDRLTALDGVERVVPRIVGAIRLGRDREPVVLVGLSPAEVPENVTCVSGAMFEPGKGMQLVVGTELARRLALEPGSRVPPFYRNRQGERVCTVTGVFESDVSLWQARLAFASFETAAAIFDQPAHATDLLVYCRTGYESQTAKAIERLEPLATDANGGQTTARVVSKAELEALVPRGLLHREGVFNLHFVLAFALGILVLLMTSGMGLSERRREIAILKATGWQTDEVLLRGAVESACLALAAAALSLLLAWAWVRGANGFFIASIFLNGVGAVPAFDVPARFTPLPAFAGLLLSIVLVGSGTLYSTWRAASAPPSEALR